MSILDLFKSEKPCIFAELSGTTVILGPVTSESVSGSVRITDNAVEDGTVISDHVNKDPESIEVRTFLCDANDLTAKAIGAATSALGLSTDSMKVSEKMELLKLWRDTGEIVTYSGPVFSGLITDGYDIIAESMVITKIDSSRSQETGSGIDVGISLRKIVIAEALMKNSKLPMAAKSRTKKGATSTKTDTTTAKPSSILSRIF